MTTTLNPYISFRGKAREVLDFYQRVFGGEIIRSTFGEMHASDDPADADLIMHSQLTTPHGLSLMVSDTPKQMDCNPGDDFSVSLSGGPDDEVELAGYWEALTGGGGSVTVPLRVAPWGDQFGMCTDRFGVKWLVNIAGTHPEAD